MKLSLILFLFIAPTVIVGQPADAVLATATGIKFTAADLSPEAGSIYTRTDEIVSTNRKQLFEQTVAEALLSAEAAVAGSTPEKLLDAAISKLPQPAPAKIKEVYDLNRDALGGRSLEQAEKQIV